MRDRQVAKHLFIVTQAPLEWIHVSRSFFFNTTSMYTHSLGNAYVFFFPKSFSRMTTLTWDSRARLKRVLCTYNSALTTLRVSLKDGQSMRCIREQSILCAARQIFIILAVLAASGGLSVSFSLLLLIGELCESTYQCIVHSGLRSLLAT